MDKLQKILREYLNKGSERIDVTMVLALIDQFEKDTKEQCDIPIVRDSLNFGFCKYPKDICDTQCQDCKAEEMWGNKNLH